LRAFRKTTILDVAKLAGVSHTTVSLFLKGRQNACSEATAERIRTAIQELQYTPSTQSKILQGARTHVVGVSLQPGIQENLAWSNVFSERIWSGLISSASARGLRILIFPETEQQAKTARPFLDGQIDGLIVSEESGNDRLIELTRAGMPTIAMTRSLDLPAGIGAVYANEDDTMALVLDHLFELGHRKFGHVCGPSYPADAYPSPAYPPSDIARWREATFRSRTNAHGDQISAPNTWEEYDLVPWLKRQRSLPDPITAVVCANDRLALSVVRAALQLGLRIPEDLSVTGVDNDPLRERDLPYDGLRLTTVDIPCEQLGRIAVEALDRLIHGSQPEDCRVNVPVTRLIIGNSSGPVNPKQAG
jgi:LacI family transcriptional regulator